MFSTRQQSIPKVFIEKMKIDAEIEKTVAEKVVGMEAMTKLFRKQRWLREDCIRAVQKKDSFSGATA